MIAAVSKKELTQFNNFELLMDTIMYLNQKILYINVERLDRR